MTEEVYQRAVEIHKKIAENNDFLLSIEDPSITICDKEGKELEGEEREKAIIECKELLGKEIKQLQQEFERL